VIEKFHRPYTGDMNYWQYMENPWLAGFLSFLIGFGIAAMFRPMCRGSDCIVLHGPPVRDVVNKVYQMGEKCVEFTTEVLPCPTDGSSIVKTVQMVAS
jgi:hypothetical protein